MAHSKNGKRFIALFMIVICIITMIPCKSTSAFAEIDLSNHITESLEQKLTTKINGIETKAIVDIKTELLTDYKVDTNESRQLYKVEAISAFETNVDNSGNLTVTPIASVSERTLSEYSESYKDLLQLKTTIYYETGTYNNVGYIKLTQVDTDVDYIGSMVKSKRLKLRYGYYGYNLDTGILMQSQYTSPWSSKLQALFLSKTATCPHLELTPGGIPYSIFGEAECEASRGNYTFTVSHSVHEIDSFSPASMGNY